MDKNEPDLNKVYQKIQDLLKNKGQVVSVLEEQVDVEMQMEYFKFSKNQGKDFDKEHILNEKGLLFSEDTTVDRKKELLVSLAKIDDPEAYRAIEDYKNNADEELKSWSVLAFQESKMVLETSLLGSAPIFISTGLGGQGSNLRYFVVLVAAEDKPFEKWQCDLVEKEVGYLFESEEGEIESMEFDNDKVLIKVLLPISTNIKDFFSKGIKECNEFGNFLTESFLVTNVKELSIEEVDELIQDFRLNKENGGEADDSYVEDIDDVI
ncbi:hypothetical protein [Plebeiibacterium marinum]|uniref:Uncharacterized protein n=1 Tax=Plebeiibacterium marinum TaxID=2992111 RepID=A0AAE3MF00_9BACT|nr:hypothetical protein [Plebeiobacterium marinum]MCW3806599.1 hypothetical protein [Plebeiobacterium marinum]